MVQAQESQHITPKIINVRKAEVADQKHLKKRPILMVYQYLNIIPSLWQYHKDH